MAKCKLGEILIAATEEESAALSLAIIDVRWPAKSLANAVNKTRFSVGATTVKEHRRQSCGCFQ